MWARADGVCGGAGRRGSRKSVICMVARLWLCVFCTRGWSLAFFRVSSLVWLYISVYFASPLMIMVMDRVCCLSIGRSWGDNLSFHTNSLVCSYVSLYIISLLILVDMTRTYRHM